MRERMRAGELYVADDPVLTEENQRAMALIEAFNRSPASNPAVRRRLLSELLGSFGNGAEVQPPFYCDYGYQTSIGAGTFVYFGLVVVDVARVSIGDDVQIGPRVQLLTATHPPEAGPRRDKWESARPIVVGDNVWLGGGVTRLPRREDRCRHRSRGGLGGDLGPACGRPGRRLTCQGRTLDVPSRWLQHRRRGGPGRPAGRRPGRVLSG